MPFFESAHARLHYQLEGADDAPVLMLSNSLGTHLGMWAPQMPSLLSHFRVLRYDARGHGQSSVPDGPYSIAQLGADAIALIDHLRLDRVHFCGLSMGGMTGLWLALNHAARIDRLVLCNTAARIGPPEMWDVRIEAVLAQGLAAIVPAVLDRWFTRDFRHGATAQVELVRAMLQTTTDAGYVASCAAVRDMDQRGQLGAISVPTLVIAGRQDMATPPADGRFLADHIAGARYVELNAAHLSNWEVAQAFTMHVCDFLLDQDQGPARRQSQNQGSKENG